MVKILIVDDHVLFREGLKLLLSARPGTTVVAEAGTGPEAVRAAAETKPDIVVLDIAMPGGNGLDAIPRILAAAPGAGILVLSSFDDDKLVKSALTAGARGYVLKADAFAEMDDAIRHLQSGHRHLSPKIADGFFSGYLRGEKSSENFPEGPLARLTDRESAVLRLICEGKYPKEIAAEFGISRKTVDIHKRNILNKLGIDNDAALIKLALKEGVLPGCPV